MERFIIVSKEGGPGCREKADLCVLPWDNQIGIVAMLLLLMAQVSSPDITSKFTKHNGM